MPANIYSHIKAKMDRALRNGTGCNLSHLEIVALLHSEVWPLIAKIEWEEMRAANPIETEEGTTE